MSADRLDARLFARVTQDLLAEPEEELTLQRVVDLAVQMVPGCDFAGISLRRSKGKIETPALTDPIVRALDDAQYELDEGPCLDAIRGQDTYLIEDTGRESRWPRWAPLAAELGARSVLSVRLATAEQVVGGLNMYSARPYAYDDDAMQIAHVYAAHASAAVAVTEQVAGLRTALQNRHTIGMAQGMLLLRYGLTEDQAFQFLARISQESNIKLRDVAVRVQAELAKEGWPGSS